MLHVVGYTYQTSQELWTLSSVALFCQVIMIVMNWGSQLSEMSSCSQKLTSLCGIKHSLSCVIFPHNCFVFFFFLFNVNINAMSLSNGLRKMGVGYIGGWVDILVGGYIGGWIYWWVGGYTGGWIYWWVGPYWASTSLLLLLLLLLLCLSKWERR